MIRLCIVMLFLCMNANSTKPRRMEYPKYKVYYANGEEIQKEFRFKKEFTYKFFLKGGEELQGSISFYGPSDGYGKTTIISDEFQLEIQHDLIEKIVLISSPIYLKNDKVLKFDILEEKADFLLVKENTNTKKIAKDDIKFYNKGGGKYIKAIKSPINQGIKCSFIPTIKNYYNYESIELYATKKNEKLSKLELLPKVKRVILFASKDKYFDLTSLNKYKNITSLQININDSNDYIKKISFLKYIKSLSLHHVPPYFVDYRGFLYYSRRGKNILIYNEMDEMDKISLKLPKLSNSIIEKLDLSFSNIKGELDLKGLPKLKEISLIRSKIKDLSFLNDRIKILNITEAEIEDLSSLDTAKCKVLHSPAFRRKEHVEELKKTYPNIIFEKGSFGWEGS